MNSIEFIHKYEKYIKEIRLVIQPNLTPVIDKLADTDPHDLITPETWFPYETAARGFVWSLFLDAVNKHCNHPIGIDID